MKNSVFGAAAAALVGIVGLSLAAPLAAQPPAGAGQAPAAQQGGRGGAQPKAGYVRPPENSGGLYPIAGEPIYKARCAGCHDSGEDRAPTREQMAAKSPEEVYDALTVGAMRLMAEGMSEAEMYGVVRYLTGKSPTPNIAMGPDPNLCPRNTPIQATGPQWNGWGNGPENLRYQPRPGFTKGDVPNLKVKWAFSYVGTKNTQPLIFGDRVFVASMSGKIYSLDTGTGCVHWRHDFRGGARASMTVAKHAGAPSGYALYVGDDRQYVRALDAGSGKELWAVKVYDHPVGRITGSPTLHDGVLYVPLSSSEESQGNVGTYGCCTFIGLVVAVDARDGKLLWKQKVLDVEPRPTRKNSAGTQMYGPAGAAIWSSPTIDAKRGQLYVSTGDSYSEVENGAADAIVAMDLKTGRIKWVNQVLANDNYVTGRINAPLGQMGPDYDFGASPNLVKVGNRELVITGNKSSIVYAMDPDTGKMVWQTPKLGSGGASGGVLWGQATDGKRVYAPIADSPGRGRPGLVTLDAATGRELWRYEAKTDAPPCNVPSGRCTPNHGQAATVMPGVVFSGSGDGHLRAFDVENGKVLWDFDTALPHNTVNGYKDAPGGHLDMGGATIAGGMMFIHSGYNGSAGQNNVLLAFTPGGK